MIDGTFVIGFAVFAAIYTCLSWVSYQTDPRTDVSKKMEDAFKLPSALHASLCVLAALAYFTLRFQFAMQLYNMAGAAFFVTDALYDAYLQWKYQPCLDNVPDHDLFN